jgi:anti-sigma B factor antagonist
LTVARYDSLSTRFSRDDGTVVVHVAGEIDAATAPFLRDALIGVIDEQGSLSVRIDLGEVSVIDSTGLSVLASALMRIQEKGGQLTLANPPPALEPLRSLGDTAHHA